MTPADLTFGKRGEKRIVGPEKWDDPVKGRTWTVYRRTNKGKVQLFAIRPDGAGLGRVFDSRGERVCEPGLKFPLGLWKAAESRTVVVQCWRKDGTPFRREMTLTINDLDYTYRSVAHSLRFHWIADGGGKAGLDNEYIYSPGLGLVTVEDR